MRTSQNHFTWLNPKALFTPSFLTMSIIYKSLVMVSNKHHAPGFTSSTNNYLHWDLQLLKLTHLYLFIAQLLQKYLFSFMQMTSFSQVPRQQSLMVSQTWGPLTIFWALKQKFNKIKFFSHSENILSIYCTKQTCWKHN